MAGSSPGRYSSAITDWLRGTGWTEATSVLLLFVGSRAALTLIGIVARLILKPILHQPLTQYSAYLPLDIWSVWDSRWYLEIARHGYFVAPISPQGERITVFFPLYPFLMRMVGFVVGDLQIAGMLVSNVALLVAAVALHRLVLVGGDRDTASTAVKYLFLFPTAFLFSAVLSESLFLALAILCFYFAKQRKWWQVGIAGFLVSLVRPVGIVVLVPLLYMYLQAKGWRLRAVRPDVLWLLLIPLGFAGFAAYASAFTGSPLSILSVRAGWGVAAGNPFAVLLRGLSALRVHLLFAAVFSSATLILLTAFVRRIGGAFWLYGVLSVLVPLTVFGMPGLLSMPRYLSVVFPLPLLLAQLAMRDKGLDQGMTIFLALLQGFLMVFWTNGSLLVL